MPLGLGLEQQRYCTRGQKQGEFYLLHPASSGLPVAAQPEPPRGGAFRLQTEEWLTTQGSPGLLLQQYVDQTPAVELKLFGAGVISPSVPAHRTGDGMIPPPFRPTA